jgi:hypothetical protein
MKMPKGLKNNKLSHCVFCENFPTHLLDFEILSFYAPDLRVEIRFAEALAGTINVVLYAVFENVIKIDRNGQGLFYYSAL